MKKILFLLLGVLLTLSFASCEPIDESLSGKKYVDRIDAANYVSYQFFSKTCIKTYALPALFRSYDYYYEKVDNNIYIYRDKKHTKLWETAEYHGSYILVDDGEEITKFTLE